jgi:hypothetical protein
VLVVAVASSALLYAWVTGVVSAAGGVQGGTIEICKDAVAGDGVAGQPFSFTLMKGLNTIATGIPVTGGSCSSGIPVNSTTGNFKVIEDLSSGAYMMTDASIVNGTLVKTTLSTGTVTFTMGPSSLGETQVHVSNQIVGSTLKVCKVSQSLLNAQFSFTVQGQPATASTGSAPGVAGNCSHAFSFATGAVVTVTESVPPNEQVANVTATTGKIQSQALTTPPTATKNGVYTVTVKIRQGANALTFDNEPQPPSQRGSLEICKSSGSDPFVPLQTDPFQFVVTDSAGKPVRVPVFVNQCSGAIDVAAGNVEVDEAIPNHQFVQGISVASPGQLGPFNLNNGTAIVVVPINSAGEAQVTFTDNTFTGQLKVCKALTATSSALIGQKFKFSVTDDGLPPGTKGSPGMPITVTVTASGGSGACSILTANGKAVGPLNPALALPEGSTATVTEDLSGYAPYVTTDNPTGTAVITTGINAITITNQALGQLEICKDMVDADSAYTNFIFSFTYKNIDSTVTDPRASGTVTASPGHCHPPVLVPPGTYTVKEDLSKTTTSGGAPAPGFLFDHSYANSGLFTPSRCVPPDNSATPNCGNPLTVTVPYFNDTTNPGETQVHFVNKVPRTAIKVCKVIDPGSAGTPVASQSYTFTATQTVNGMTSPVPGAFSVSPPYPTSPGMVGLFPSACTSENGSVQLFNADGSPTSVTVTESAAPNTAVSSITVNPGTPVGGSPDLAKRTITFNPAPGPDVVTFTNTFSRCAGPEGAIPGGTPGTAAFFTNSQPAIANGCAVYVDFLDGAVGSDGTYLALEFIRGPNTGMTIEIGANGTVLTDIAMDAKGQLYGVVPDQFGTLWRVDPITGAATLIGPAVPNMTADPTALVFGPTGTLYAYQSAGGGYFDSVDPATGIASTIGPFPTGHSSSGDLAFAGGLLYLTAVDPTPDSLLKIDPSTGATTTVGPIGSGSVFGLVGSFGQLFGFTGDGKLLQIDPLTGAGTVLKTGGEDFFGAASPPGLA